MKILLLGRNGQVGWELERLLDEAEHFSPWGYELDATAQPVA